MRTQTQRVLEVGSMLYGCSEEVLSMHLAPLVAELERGEIDNYSLWEELGESLESNGAGKAQDPEKLEPLWVQMIEESLEVDPEMLDFCRELQTRMPVAALSNTIAEHAAHLEELGVYEVFNPCVLSFEVGMRKPESRIYRLACELLQTPPENCLLIDDLKDNLKGARALRMQTHLFTDIETLRSDLVKRGLI